MLSASRAALSLLALSLSLISPAWAGYRSVSSALAAQHSSDEAALRALAEDFFRAWEAKDIDGYLRLWITGSPDLESHKEAMQKLFAGYERIEVKTPVVQKVTVYGERARLRVDVEIDAVEIKTGKHATEFGSHKRVIECARENGLWRVWSEEPAIEDLAKRLAATADEEERNALLAGEKDLWSTDLTQAVNRVGIRFASQGLYPEALNVFRIAQNTAEIINDTRGLAGALGNIRGL